MSIPRVRLNFRVNEKTYMKLKKLQETLSEKDQMDYTMTDIIVISINEQYKKDFKEEN